MAETAARLGVPFEAILSGRVEVQGGWRWMTDEEIAARAACAVADGPLPSRPASRTEGT